MTDNPNVIGRDERVMRRALQRAARAAAQPPQPAVPTQSNQPAVAQQQQAAQPPANPPSQAAGGGAAVLPPQLGLQPSVSTATASAHGTGATANPSKGPSQGATEDNPNPTGNQEGAIGNQAGAGIAVAAAPPAQSHEIDDTGTTQEGSGTTDGSEAAKKDEWPPQPSRDVMLMIYACVAKYQGQNPPTTAAASRVVIPEEAAGQETPVPKKKKKGGKKRKDPPVTPSLETPAAAGLVKSPPKAPRKEPLAEDKLDDASDGGGKQGAVDPKLGKHSTGAAMSDSSTSDESSEDSAQGQAAQYMQQYDGYVAALQEKQLEEDCEEVEIV